MQYYVVMKDHYSEFISDVRSLIDLGYKLQGGVSMSIDTDGVKHFAQALIKEN